MSTDERIIYTIGTSNHQKEDFLELLDHYNIETVVDVRRFPKSKFEHFTKENFKAILEDAGRHYIYLGKELGGFRKEGYLAYTNSSTFQETVSYLELIAKKRITALVCAEKFPWKCHRRFIASNLEQKGWKVLHIIDKERVWEPKK
jgi:uncharacterized protein (DUF488 family)